MLGPTYRGFLPIMGVPENRFEEIHDAKKLYYEENLKICYRKYSFVQYY